MALQTSGSISFNQIKNEFNGTAPVRMSDYYRQGNKVKQGKQNKDVPESGEISLSDFRGASRTTNINITVVGGGGAGGAGNDDGNHYSNSRANGGGATVVKEKHSPHTEYLRAVGGQGGFHYKRNGHSDGTSGSNSSITYNGGGARGGKWNKGGDASSYGAGGGGAGGDAGSFFHKKGNAGEGGRAGELKNDYKEIPYGNILDITIGNGGQGTAPYCGSHYWKDRGGHGAGGYCRLKYDDKPAVTFTSSGTHMVD